MTRRQIVQGVVGAVLLIASQLEAIGSRLDHWWKSTQPPEDGACPLCRGVMIERNDLGTLVRWRRCVRCGQAQDGVMRGTA